MRFPLPSFPRLLPARETSCFISSGTIMNKITTNIHGSNVVNCTVGIIIQEVKPGFDVSNKDWTLPVYKRSLTRSPKVDTPQSTSTVESGPNFLRELRFLHPPYTAKCIQEYHGWSLAWVVESSGYKQLVPAFGGFFSATGVNPTQKPTIDYFNPINQPFT